MTSPFPSQLDLDVFFILFILWCLSLLLEPVLIKRGGSKNVKSREDRRTYILIYLSVFLSIIVSINFGFNEILLLPEFFIYLGMFGIIFGIFLREYSIITLGRYFSFHISVIENHKIIESGPYHYIRHPAYSGGMLAIIGISLALRSSIAVIIVIIMCAIAYGFRINFEEKVLIKEFGNDYLNYKKRTKKLIPFIF